MQIRKCDLCRESMTSEGGVSFQIALVGGYDFCDRCIKIVRRAICRKCSGKGTVSEVDNEATNAQATCGENRTQYRTVSCKSCK